MSVNNSRYMHSTCKEVACIILSSVRGYGLSKGG